MSSKYEHMKTIRFHHRSEILRDFMSLLSPAIPREYLEYMKMQYGLTADDLEMHGVRYLGGLYDAVFGEMINRYGSTVLLKAGLLFPSRDEKRTFFRFAPPMWKRIPLLIAPGESEGYIDQLVGFAPATDKALSAADTSRWFFTKIKTASGQAKLICLDKPVADGTVVLCSDFYRTLMLRKHGYEALYIANLGLFKPSWMRKFGNCRVYVEPHDVRTYPEEIDRICDIFDSHENVLRVAEVHVSDDFMGELRGFVGLPAEDPNAAQALTPGARLLHPTKAPVVVNPQGEELTVQSSLF